MPAPASAPRPDIASDFGRLEMWGRQEPDEYRRLSALDTATKDTVFEVVTWPSGLCWLGRKRGTFVLAGISDFVPVFFAFTPAAIPSLAKLAATPIDGIDFEWSCHAIAWAAGRYLTARSASGRSAGGGPRGMKR